MNILLILKNKHSSFISWNASKSNQNFINESLFFFLFAIFILSLGNLRTSLDSLKEFMLFFTLTTYQIRTLVVLIVAIIKFLTIISVPSFFGWCIDVMFLAIICWVTHLVYAVIVTEWEIIHFWGMIAMFFKIILSWVYIAIRIDSIEMIIINFVRFIVTRSVLKSVMVLLFHYYLDINPEFLKESHHPIML